MSLPFSSRKEYAIVHRLPTLHCCLVHVGVQAFDLGAEVCPIAIKYNKQFVDAFWNSARPFHWHLFDLMTSWAVSQHLSFCSLSLTAGLTVGVRRLVPTTSEAA